MDELTKTVEVNGITVTVDISNFNDYEFLELLAGADDGDVTSAIKLNAALFGKDQWTRIKKELREQNGGKLPVQQTVKFVTDVFKKMDELLHVEDAEKNLHI